MTNYFSMKCGSLP